LPDMVITGHPFEAACESAIADSATEAVRGIGSNRDSAVLKAMPIPEYPDNRSATNANI